MIELAIESGINWLDTSENYLETRNESVIGAALQRVEGAFLVASKVAPRAGVTGGGSGFRRDQVHQACRESLRRLGREHIDVYFLHWPDDTGVPLEETWGAMAELVDAGLVRAIGMSNYEIEDVERCHAERPVDCIQVGLNLIDYLDDRASIARCVELGIAATIYEPLASGILSDKTLDQVLAAWIGPVDRIGLLQALAEPRQGRAQFRCRRRAATDRGKAGCDGRPGRDRVGPAPAGRWSGNRGQPERQPRSRKRRGGEP